MLLILSVCVASLATYSTTLPLESGPEDIRISQDLAGKYSNRHNI